MKIILIVINLFICVNAIGQTKYWKVDQDSVKLLISDSNKATYYPKLLSKFLAFDTSLSLSDYRLLYYGFVENDEYSAYTDTKTTELNAALNQKDYAKASLISDSVLKVAPVNLKANYYKALSIFLLDSINLPYWKYSNRYTKLMKAILSTGNGFTCESSFKVLYVSDEYEIIYKHFMVENFYSQSLVLPCDKLRIQANERFNSSEIYFDISESFKKMNKLFNEPGNSEKKKKKKRNQD